eukprot:GHVS01026202.1.p1 GENE.GHVS01026202.1~~GHVS01026202.1.p1  ORF type:complete len:833 (-),score=133.99 GHVS01026202.1:274-2772(-)
MAGPSCAVIDGCDRVTTEADFYEVLGVTKSSTTTDIRKAFRVQAKALHPDKGGGDPVHYRLLHKAYEVLSDKKLREHYDSTGRTEKSAEEEFLEGFQRGGSSGTRSLGGGGDNSEAIDFSQRIVRPLDAATHTSGFEEWLRTRNVSKSTIDDDFIRNSLGVSKAAYETVAHNCKHPTARLVKKELNQQGRAVVSGGNAEDLVQRNEIRLRKELEWGELLVNILFAPVNPYDITMLRLGEDLLWSYHKEQPSDMMAAGGGTVGGGTAEAGRNVLGSEGIAVVVGVGPGVKEAKEGDWVMPLRDNLGTWQTAAIWRERDLLKIPPQILPREYAAVAKELFLAYHLLQEFAGDLQPGDAILINAANSLVGQTVVQLSKLLGLRAIAIIRRHPQFERVAEHLQDLGANRVYAEDEGVRTRLLRDHAALPRVAFDCVLGSGSTTQLVHALQEGGRLVVFGGLSGHPLNVPWHLFVSHDVKIRSFYLAKWLEKASNQQLMLNALENIGKLLEAKKLIVGTQEVPLERYELALASIRTSGRLTKPILKPPTIQEEEIAYSSRLVAEKEEKENAKRIVENLFMKEKQQPNNGEREDKRERLVTVTVPCECNHRSSLIFLHNSGEVPEEYEAMFKRFLSRDESLASVKVILPEGPMTEYEDDEELPCWYSQQSHVLFDSSTSTNSSTASMTPSEVAVLQGMEKSCDLLANLIEKEIAAIRAGRVIIAGFDQGAIMALFTAVTKLEVAIGGILCFGLPPLSRKVLNFLNEKAFHPAAKKIKIFVLNGSHDPECSPVHTETMRQRLVDEGFSLVTVEAIPNGIHEVGDEQLAHLSAVMGLVMS